MQRQIAIVLVALAVCSACSTSTPTQPEPAAPASFDGGFLGGSGNTAAETEEEPAGVSSTEADSVGRGGFLGGSGN